MPSLTELPTELRQQILLLALPETNRVESVIPTQFIHLFHINQCLRQDMSAVAPIWTPIHYISQPSTLTSCAPRTRGWNCSRICLDVFYAAFLGRIETRFWTHGSPNHKHAELVLDWINAVPFLPQEVEEVWLDVTPAPAEKRVPHPRWRECGPPWFDLFLHGDLPARRFLGGHVQDVAELVRKLDERYGRRLSVKFSGRLSVKSEFFVQAVGQEVGREIEFVGSWVSNEGVLGAAVSSRLLCSMAREHGHCGSHVLAWLSGVAWSREAGDVYADLVGPGRVHEVLVIGDVEAIANFFKSEGEGMAMQPLGNELRRTFQQRIAVDMGLRAVETGEDDDKHVVVSR